MIILDAALRYLRAGLSAIPIRRDGSKAPAAGLWAPYQTTPPTDAEARRLFWDGLGVAILGGKVSGNLEILDFDRPGVFDEWRQIVDDQAPGLVDRLPLVETPDGGRHLYYRCEQIGGSIKLAMARTPFRKASGKESICIIEIKGEGGYVLAPPSPAECHPANRPYKQLAGPALPEIPQVLVAERRLMLAAARTFDETLPAIEVPRDPTPHTGLRPGDDFNAREVWRNILVPHGWRADMHRGEITYWRRPGKEERGTSATTGFCDRGDLLYVFSTSAAPFEDRKGYTKFAAFTMLNHGGDWSRAARALVDAGFGAQKPPTTSTKPDADGAIEKRRLRVWSYAEMEAHWKDTKTETRIPSGIDCLDEAVGGGLPVGQVTTIIGNTGVGKSEFARQVRRNMADAGYPVVHVDVELGTRRIVDRDVAQLAEMASSILHQPSQSDAALSSIEDAFSALRGLPIYTIPCLGAPPINELRGVVEEAITMARQGGSNGGAKPVAIFLDSGQRLAAGVGLDDQRLRNQQFWEWAEALSRAHDCAVVVTSEQKRSEKGGTPTPDQLLHSGAESRAIEYTSDLVLGLIEDGTPADMVAGRADEESSRTVKILIAKVRDGRVGYLRHEILFTAPCWDMHVVATDDHLTTDILKTIIASGATPIGAGAIAAKIKKRKQAVHFRCRELERLGHVIVHASSYGPLGYTTATPPPFPTPVPGPQKK